MLHFNNFLPLSVQRFSNCFGVHIFKNMSQCLMLTENMSKVHKEITIVLDFFYTKLFLNLPKAFLAYIENSFKEIKCIVRIRQTYLAVQGEYADRY